MKRGRKRQSETHFPCGHERAGNTYYRVGASALCATCKRIKSRRYYLANVQYFKDYQKQYRTRPPSNAPKRFLLQAKWKANANA